jgi:PleD family two-component response regulator
LPQSDLDFIAESRKREALDRKQKEHLRRLVQWVGAAALVLVTIFATVAGVFAVRFYEASNDARTAKDVAVRSQAKYDILKATIIGTDRKLDLEIRRNVPPRTARAVVNDLTKTYDLLDGSSLNALFEVGAGTRSILWFDTAHENNQTETAAFLKLGFSVVPVSTIEDAISQLQARPFNVILTHFGNNPGGVSNSNAYRLKAALRQASLTRFPVIIYTIGVTDRFICDAQREGFYDETEMPAQLIDIVARAIRGESRIEHCPP